MAKQVRAAIPSDPRSVLLEAAHVRTGPGALIRLAGKLADSRPARSDPAHLAALQRLLSHEVLAVRRAAVRTAYSYSWPELYDIVFARYQEDEKLAPQLEHLLSYLKSQRSDSERGDGGKDRDEDRDEDRDKDRDKDRK